MAAILSPIAGAAAQFFTNAGVVLAGGKLFTYVGGSVNTAQATYTDSTQATPNANPIILDSAGRPPNEVWLLNATSYKFVLMDANNNILGTWDNILGINSNNTPVLTEWTLTNLTPTYISATSFSLLGNQTSTLTPNRRLQIKLVSGYAYGYVVSSTYDGSVATTVVVAMDGGTSLDSTISIVNFAALNSLNPSIPQQYITTAGGTFTGPITAPVVATSLNQGSLAGFRNRIMNGNFNFNVVTPPGVITPGIGRTKLSDRWTSYIQAGAYLSFTPTYPDAPFGFSNCMRIVCLAYNNNPLNTRFELAQAFEGFNVSDLLFLNGSAPVTQTLSGMFKFSSSSGGSGNLVLAVIIRDASDNFVASAALTVPYTTPATWVKASATQTPSFSGFVTNRDNTVGFSVSLSLANMIGFIPSPGNVLEVTGLQLEIGPVATPYEQRTTGVERALCDRYARLAAPGSTGLASSTTAVQLGIVHSGMRAAPTIANLVGTVATVTDSVASFSQSAAGASVGTNTADGGFYNLTNFTGLTQFRPAILSNENLLLTAELTY